MTVYIDVLIILNAYISYFTLKAAAMLLHIGYKLSRIIIASVFGGIISLTALIPLDFFGGSVLRLVLTVLMSALAFGITQIKKLLLRSAVTAAAGALICGAVILLREYTGNSFFGLARGYVYLDISVMTLILSTTAVYISISLFRRFLDKPLESEQFKIEIKHKSRTVILNAFADSGNSLKDFLTGLPVIICKHEKISELIPEPEIKEEIPKGVRLIPFSSVGGGGIITAFRPEHITIHKSNGDKKEINALIGTNETSLKGENFDAIFNPKILI